MIIGDAGSGKSVLTRVLEHRQACDGLRVGGEAVNLLVTPLPSLDAPAVDWVPETLRRIYGFSERRVAEAQKRTTNKVDPLRLLIIGDARDELPSAVQDINLFTSNRLERWGAGS